MIEMSQPPHFPSTEDFLKEFFKIPTVIKKTDVGEFEISTIETQGRYETVIFLGPDIIGREIIHFELEEVMEYHADAEIFIKKSIKKIAKFTKGEGK